METLASQAVPSFVKIWDQKVGDGSGGEGGQLDALEWTASNSWKLHFNPRDCNSVIVDRFIEANEAIVAWKKAVSIRKDLHLPIEWRSQYYPYNEVDLLDSPEDLDSLVHEHAYGDMRLLTQCLLHQERLTGTVDPEVPDLCTFYRWKSAKQYVDLLIYLSNFRELDLAKALDFPQCCQVDTTLAHVCDLIDRIVASQRRSWSSGAVWFLLAIFSEERYCRHRLRQEARKLKSPQRRSIERLIAYEPWFADQDVDLVNDLVPALNSANL